MVGDGLGFLGVNTLFHKNVFRSFSRSVVVCSLLPRLRARYQAIKQLAEIGAVEFDSVSLVHNSTELPGQEGPRVQAFVFRNSRYRARVMATGKRWTREELLVALNIYRKLTFGQLDQRNPVIQQVAKKLDRTPGSLAMKLSNFASLDPALQARGIRGLVGASSLDREVWKEFRAEAATLGPQSEEALRNLFKAHDVDEVEVVAREGVRVRRAQQPKPPDGPTEQMSQVKVRRGQQFFRQMILNVFDSRCCITGIAVRELLVASHILPWGEFPKERLNPENGLCLSRLHDAAFDQGFIALDDDYRLLLSRDLRAHLPQPSLEQNFVAFAGQPIHLLPDAPAPKRDFLRYHRQEIFHG